VYGQHRGRQEDPACIRRTSTRRLIFRCRASPSKPLPVKRAVWTTFDGQCRTTLLLPCSTTSCPRLRRSASPHSTSNGEGISWCVAGAIRRRLHSDVSCCGLAVDASCDVLHPAGGLHRRACDEVFATIRADLIGCAPPSFRKERCHSLACRPGVNLAAFVLRLAFEIHYLDFFPTTF
jgi:hypothetical protein